MSSTTLHTSRFEMMCGTLVLLLMLSLGGCWVGKPKHLEAGPPISFDSVPIVYGYGRKHRTTFVIDEADAAKLQSIFTPPAATAWDERQQIRSAVALMEQIAGEQTPTHGDLGGPLVYAPYGAMDCVDESTNTTEYLRLFDQQGWLRHHLLLHTIMRAPLFNVHNTAQIMERETGKRFVIDSWHLDNGEMPYVQDVHDWMNSKDWPVEENPELAEEETGTDS